MELASKNLCTGCGNCELVCKKNAIEFKRDELGHIYPFIDSSKCVECGLCYINCPAINNVKKYRSQSCFVSYSTNREIRKSSASGGVAQSIYNYCLNHDILFSGVYFDKEELTARHKLGFTKEDICQFRNSKYTFSFMDNICEDIVHKLIEGAQIVFVALPCQVAALKKYVEAAKVKFDNLLTIDIICHGVPSDLYLKEHIQTICKGEKIENLSFRDERFVTSKFVFSVDFMGKNYHKYVESDDNFQIGYHNATIYRPNCYNCIYAGAERCGDLTIGDFNGLGKAEHIERRTLAEMKYQGVSCVLCNSDKGQEFLASLEKEHYLFTSHRPLEEALNFEKQLMKPSVPSSYRNRFVELYPKVGFSQACNIVFRKEKMKRPIIHTAKQCVKKMLGWK